MMPYGRDDDDEDRDRNERGWDAGDEYLLMAERLRSTARMLDAVITAALPSLPQSAPSVRNYSPFPRLARLSVRFASINRREPRCSLNDSISGRQR